jgi:tetratricopeptide (TPR) repeat protein
MRSVRTILFLCALSVTAQLTAQSAEAFFRSGREAFLKNDADRAAALFEKAVAADPRKADYHYWLGSAYGRQAQKANKLKQALLAKKTREQFEEAVKLDPKHEDARFGLIEFYLLAPGFMGGGEDKAYAQANELRRIDPLSGHRAWSRIYSFQKKPDLARKEMLDAVREQPQSAKAHYFLGITYLSEKNYTAAAGMFEKAHAIDPNHTATWFRLGQTAAFANANLPRGEELLRKYLTTRPGDEDPPLARAHYWLGMVLEKQGRKPEARQQFQASLRLTPGAKDVTEALRRVS